MKLLDLAKFSKVKEDEHTTELHHQDGIAKMVILHGKLPSIQREQLKRLKLSKGGQVDDVDDLYGDEKRQKERDKKESDSYLRGSFTEEDEANHQGMSGHPIKKYDDGGAVSADSSGAPAPSPPADDSAQPAAAAAGGNPITINVGQPAASVAAVPAVAPIVNPTPSNQPLTQGPGNPAALNLANPTNATNVPAQAVTNAAQANNEQAGVDISKAQGTIPIAQQQQQNALAIQQRQNDTINEMKQHTDAFAQWNTEHPQDSSAYWNKMSDGQKYQTSLGLFLGGLGGGGRSNVALDYLNRNIDRNVDDQKSNFGRQNTIWGAYQQLYGDENVSTNLTKVSMNDKLMADANLLAAQLGTPQAIANRDKLNSDLMLKNAELLRQSAYYANGPKHLPGAPGVAPAAGAGGASSGGAGSQPDNSSAITGGSSPNGHGPRAGHMGPGQNVVSYGPQSADSGGFFVPKPMLKNNSDRVLSNFLIHSSPDVKDPNYPPAAVSETMDEYKKVQNADEIRASLPEVFRQLKDSATTGGHIGRNSGNALSALAGGIGGAEAGPLVGGLGAAIGHGAGDVLGSTISAGRSALGLGTNAAGQSEQSQDRDYETIKGQLLDKIATLLKDTPGGAESVERAKAFIPDDWHDPDNIKKQMSALDDLITSKIPKGLLKHYGFIN